MKKIVMIISGLGSGGAERVLVDLSKGFLRKDIEVTVVTIGKFQNDFYTLDKNIKRLCLNEYKNFNPFKLREIIINESPDCIISFMDKTNIKTIVSTLYSGIPLIVTEHSDLEKNSLSLPWALLRLISYFKADKIIGVSQPIIDYFKYIDVKKKKVIQNPLTENIKESAIEYANPNLIWIGRHEKVKNLGLFIGAIELLAKKRSDFQVTILGDGKERLDWERYVSEKELTHIVNFLGNVSNPYKYLENSKILVNTSESEGFGNVMIEAMSVGIPIIATPTIGAKEIVMASDSGIVLNSFSKEELAISIEYLLDNLDICNEFVRNNKVKAYKYDINNIIEEWMSTIQEVIRK